MSKKFKAKAGKNPEAALRKAPAEKEFILADGKRIKDYLDLAIAFRDMPQEIYMHHVNDNKNDFAAWVLGVFEDKDLADTLAKGTDCGYCEIAIIKHIANRL